MIITVWILSGLISIPPLLGWKAEGEANNSFVETLFNLENQTNVEIIRNGNQQESKLVAAANITEPLEAIIYPQCGVSQPDTKVGPRL